MKFFCFLSITIIIPIVLVAQSQNDWITYFEKSGYTSTPDYSQTVEYFQKLADFSSYAKFYSFGISPQGRELKYLILSKNEMMRNETFDKNKSRASDKPTVLIINGIHSGEIEGKDASMLLLREILITKENEFLLDSLNVIVVPIFSVDAHERRNKYNRINQNGPEEMGWRTTVQNLNLNRDWMKADALEMQAMLNLFQKYLPDFIVDTHTTDGADYQYTITYQVERFANMYSETAEWLGNKFIPYLEKKVDKKGFLIFPYVALRNWGKGLDEGIANWASSPRLSTGYFALQNRPSLLVETHMIKPYKDRVYSTKAVLETLLNFVYDNSTELKTLNNNADIVARTPLQNQYLPTNFRASDFYEEIEFMGYEYYSDSSEISGGEKIVYTNKPNALKIKYYSDVQPSDSVKVAKGYYIPKEYSELVFRMKLHGIKTTELEESKKVEVTRYKFNNVKFSNNSYEGRQQVNLDYNIFSEVIELPKGTIYVSTNQRASKIITYLLEPKCADSFVRWGFMNSIFEQKEYFENYVMEKIAEQMLKDDPELKKEFDQKLIEDEAFRNNPNERLNFFYKRSPYWDQNLNLYPIMRVDQ